MLSASKLCQSVSTSGPSAIWKPSPTKTSSSRSHACVTRWAWPRTGLPANSVRSSRSAATRAVGSAALPSCVARVAIACGHLLHRLVHGLAGGALLVDRGEPAELRLELRQRALLAQQPAVERGHRLERVGTRRSRRAPRHVRRRSRRSRMVLSGVMSVRVEAPRMDSGACRSRASALPGRPPGARKSQERHGWRA